MTSIIASVHTIIISEQVMSTIHLRLKIYNLDIVNTKNVENDFMPKCFNGIGFIVEMMVEYSFLILK